MSTKDSFVKNAADKKQVASAELKEKDREKQALDDVKFILSTTQGRRFIWRLISLCGVYRSSFTGNSTTFFNEGGRNIGLQLVADIHNVDPDAYASMIKEHNGQTS